MGCNTHARGRSRGGDCTTDLTQVPPVVAQSYPGSHEQEIFFRQRPQRPSQAQKMGYPGPTNSAIPYGRRLIASRIDELAHQDPNGVWISIPSARPIEGLRDFTWAEGANAINRAAWWLESKLGYGSGQGPVAHMGPQDIRHIILLVAAIKTKHRASTIM